MPADTVLELTALLFFKHFVVDFPLQAFPFQYKNKGIYGHPGGILHSGLHFIGTFIVLIFYVSPTAAGFFALIDFVAHYHIDWAKMNLNRKLGYTPTTHEGFWILLGLDQFLHALTYLGIVFLILKDFIK